MTNHANGSPMPQIGTLATSIQLSASAAFNEAVLSGAAMLGDAPHGVEIDYTRYQRMLDDPSMSEADKRILIEALWKIVNGFVQLGFGVHPVQQATDAREAREQDCGKAQNILATDAPDSVDSQDTDNAPQTGEGGPE